ncbi:MAG: fibronectin type III domain-containing protein, partial [Rhodoluna sp.]
NGTVVKVSFIEDLTRPRNIIDSSYAYYSSVIVHWLTGTGDSATVPATAANKPLTLTMTNPSILPGARVFMIINGVATEAAEATQAGQVTIEITQDPEFVIAATKPSLPTSVTATAVSGSQATVSWAAPASTGGAPITGYTVTASPGGATCSTTTALTCDVTGLTSAVSYSYSVVADNAIGSSGVRSTTVTYVPPAPTPAAPANTVPATEVSSGVAQARSAEVAAGAEVATEAEVSTEVSEETTDEPTSNPVAERIRKGDTGIAAYVIGLGVAGGLLVLVLVGLLIMLMRRRSNS